VVNFCPPGRLGSWASDARRSLWCLASMALACGWDDVSGQRGVQDVLEMGRFGEAARGAAAGNGAYGVGRLEAIYVGETRALG
jgi:hypothetical protein